ncbi:MAG: DUF4440 domain-containing protein [Halobacteriaceae archaeon]
MPTLRECRREVEQLHAFFVEWYAGAVARDRFDRLEGALAPGFGMVTPEGERLDRAAVVEAVRTDYGRDDPGEFDIDIRNVERAADCGACVAVRYEEHQRGEAETARLSTAILRESADAPGGLAWLDVHETWL